MTWLPIILVLAACGRVHFDARPDAPDCRPPVSTLPPEPTGPFGPPQLLATLNSADSDDDPTLTADELEIIFQSLRGGTSRLWRSVRTAKNAPWPPPTPIVELDGLDLNTPELSRDGLRLRLSATGPTGTPDLYVSIRADRASPWGVPVLVTELVTDDANTGSAEFLGGHALVFFSTRPGGNTMGDLWEAFDDSCAGFTAPAVLSGGVTSAAVKANPWMRDDGLTVAYATAGATGASDLHVARRTVVGGAFDAPVELTALNSAAGDDDPWLNDAMDVIYFMSPRTGNAELYTATR